MIIIRKYKHSDKASIVKLWQENIPIRVTQKQEETPLKQELKEFELLFVAENAGQIIGTCKVIYENQQDWTFSITISPQFNEQCIKTKLLQHASSQLNKLA